MRDAIGPPTRGFSKLLAEGSSIQEKTVFNQGLGRITQTPWRGANWGTGVEGPQSSNTVSGATGRPRPHRLRRPKEPHPGCQRTGQNNPEKKRKRNNKRGIRSKIAEEERRKNRSYKRRLARINKRKTVSACISKREIIDKTK